jgi:hypothetical protein
MVNRIQMLTAFARENAEPIHAMKIMVAAPAMTPVVRWFVPAVHILPVHDVTLV